MWVWGRGHRKNGQVRPPEIWCELFSQTFGRDCLQFHWAHDMQLVPKFSPPFFKSPMSSQFCDTGKLRTSSPPAWSPANTPVAPFKERRAPVFPRATLATRGIGDRKSQAGWCGCLGARQIAGVLLIARTIYNQFYKLWEFERSSLDREWSVVR
jgi:hypothetical protein